MANNAPRIIIFEEKLANLISFLSDNEVEIKQDVLEDSIRLGACDIRVEIEDVLYTFNLCDYFTIETV